MVSTFQLTLVFVFVLVSLVLALDPRFVNKPHHSPSLVKWSSIADPIDTGLPDLSKVFVYPLERGFLSLESTQHFKTLSFKVKSRTSKGVCTVTFEDPFTKGLHFPKENGSCLEISTASIGDADNQLEAPYFLFLTVYSPSSGFAIWDILGDGSVHVPVSQLQLREHSHPLETFLHPPTNGNLSSVYFSLLIDGDLPDGNARCLTVQSSILDFKLETYYAIEGWASSNRSAQVQRSDGALCLRNELFAQGLGPIQVTFSVTNMKFLHFRSDVPILFTVVSFWKDNVSKFGRLNLLQPDRESINDFSLTHYPWLFYNRELFKYNVTSNSSKPVRICDMLANCYQMEEVVNGTMGKDGSKQYTVPEKVHSQLKYSPVVRIVTEDQETKMEMQYFYGEDEAFSRMVKYFTSAGFGLNVPQELGFFHFLTNSTINTTAGQAADLISLPIHFLDQRVQQLFVSLTSLQADVFIESVHLQFASGAFNTSTINLSVKVGQFFSLDTADFFRLPDHVLPSAGRQLTGFHIAYRTLGQKNETEEKKVQVGVSVLVKRPNPSESSETIVYRPKVKFHFFGGGTDWRNRSDNRLTFNLTRNNSAALLQSNWIPANPIPQTDSWTNNQGHIRVSYRSADGKVVKLPEKALRVKQITLGLANEYVNEKVLVQQGHENNIYEPIRMHSSLRNDRYALFYRISLEEGALDAMGDGKVHVDFEWNFEEIDSALPSSPLCKGPTYGDVFCRLEPYTCPEYYFKYNPGTGSCKMIERN